MITLNNVLTPKRSILAAGAVALACVLSACGGAGGTSPAEQTAAGASEEEQAKLMVSLTDAEGDFLTYVVDVTSITLHRSNGAEVEVLTEATTVDFAQYVDISELLAVRSVPVGRYDAISLNVDFSEAQVTVQSEEGEALEAELLNAEGEPLDTAGVQIDFGTEGALSISRAAISHITLDFDLDASNIIEIDGAEATVTVAPVWVADPLQEDPKPMRLRGALNEVDELESSFELAVRPFRKLEERFGEATVYVDSDTAFEINNAEIANEAGLSELSSLLDESDERVAVVALGVWNRDTGRYLATDVLAGDSVPWSGADVLRGTVIARSDNTITVRGALLELADGRALFNDDITLLVGEATSVLKRGEASPNIADISIGSALRVIGTLIDDQTLDASAGTVRVIQGSLSGTVVSESPLQLDLAFINGRRATLFDFTGTGTSAENDADADAYEIATGDLNLQSVVNGDPLRVFGFAQAFGQAPEDFDAVTVIDASEVQGVLVANYGRDSEVTPLTINDANQLLLDLSESRAALVRAGVPVNLPEDTAMVIDSTQYETGIFSIVIGRSVEVFTQRVDFIDTLNRYINEETPLFRFTAQGEYDSLLHTLYSKRMQVHFVEKPMD